MTDQPIDQLQNARDELAANDVLWPDEFMLDLSPQAALVLLRQTAMCTLTIVTAASASLDDGTDDVQPAISNVLNGVAYAVAGSTLALTTLGVLPVQALDALTMAIPGQAAQLAATPVAPAEFRPKSWRDDG